MRKKAFIFCSFIAILLQGYAQPVSFEEATFSIFNADNEFVVVSEMIEAVPILAYSTESHFDAENIIPCKDEILQANVPISNSWEEQETSFEERENTAVSSTSLITTKWKQGKLYHYYALEDEKGTNGKAATTTTQLYTVFFNLVNEPFKFPLIGFVNISIGSHNLPQIGFVNWNTQNFKTVQLGFVNSAGGNMAGLQMGFVNTVVKGVNGVQMGFVNTVAEDMSGVQMGFVNTVAKNMSGVQMGFVNTTVNKLGGAQISFVNVAKQLTGLQFGFINYVDSIEKGVPVGFLSIVRKGGYKAIELGVSDISPFNLSFKIGVELLYTSFGVSYNPFRHGIREQIICGVGLGSIIKLGETFFINPEVISYNAINKIFQHYLSVVPSFGYKIIPSLSVALGPSIVWTYADKEVESPFYSFVKNSVDDTNVLYLGARMGIRFSW
ncbi:MAG: Spi family protease inhibitor [Bacteroidales bacterium]|jgi:hypothetical protein|nr:Spi family protease inhibitor [Bacteroidales bacterium]